MNEALDGEAATDQGKCTCPPTHASGGGGGSRDCARTSVHAAGAVKPTTKSMTKPHPPALVVVARPSTAVSTPLRKQQQVKKRSKAACSRLIPQEPEPFTSEELFEMSAMIVAGLDPSGSWPDRLPAILAAKEERQRRMASPDMPVGGPTTGNAPTMATQVPQTKGAPACNKQSPPQQSIAAAMHTAPVHAKGHKISHNSGDSGSSNNGSNASSNHSSRRGSDVGSTWGTSTEPSPGSSRRTSAGGEQDTWAQGAVANNLTTTTTTSVGASSPTASSVSSAAQQQQGCGTGCAKNLSPYKPTMPHRNTRSIRGAVTKHSKVPLTGHPVKALLGQAAGPVVGKAGSKLSPGVLHPYQKPYSHTTSTKSILDSVCPAAIVPSKPGTAIPSNNKQLTAATSSSTTSNSNSNSRCTSAATTTSSKRKSILDTPCPPIYTHRHTRDVSSTGSSSNSSRNSSNAKCPTTKPTPAAAVPAPIHCHSPTCPPSRGSKGVLRPITARGGIPLPTTAALHAGISRKHEQQATHAAARKAANEPASDSNITTPAVAAAADTKQWTASTLDLMATEAAVEASAPVVNPLLRNPVAKGFLAKYAGLPSRIPVRPLSTGGAVKDGGSSNSQETMVGGSPSALDDGSNCHGQPAAGLSTPQGNSCQEGRLSGSAGTQDMKPPTAETKTQQIGSKKVLVPRLNLDIVFKLKEASQHRVGPATTIQAPAAGCPPATAASTSSLTKPLPQPGLLPGQQTGHTPSSLPTQHSPSVAMAHDHPLFHGATATTTATSSGQLPALSPTSEALPYTSIHINTLAKTPQHKLQHDDAPPAPLVLPPLIRTGGTPEASSLPPATRPCVPTPVDTAATQPVKYSSPFSGYKAFGLTASSSLFSSTSISNFGMSNTNDVFQCHDNNDDDVLLGSTTHLPPLAIHLGPLPTKEAVAATAQIAPQLSGYSLCSSCCSSDDECDVAKEVSSSHHHHTVTGVTIKQKACPSGHSLPQIIPRSQPASSSKGGAGVGSAAVARQRPAAAARHRSAQVLQLPQLTRPVSAALHARRPAPTGATATAQGRLSHATGAVAGTMRQSMVAAVTRQSSSSSGSSPTPIRCATPSFGYSSSLDASLSTSLDTCRITHIKNSNWQQDQIWDALSSALCF